MPHGRLQEARGAEGTRDSGRRRWRGHEAGAGTARGQPRPGHRRLLVAPPVGVEGGLQAGCLQLNGPFPFQLRERSRGRGLTRPPGSRAWTLPTPRARGVRSYAQGRCECGRGRGRGRGLVTTVRGPGQVQLDARQVSEACLLWAEDVAQSCGRHPGPW